MPRNLVNPMNFNADKIIFSNAEENTIPGQKLSYRRIKISYLDNGDLSDLVLRSPSNDLLTYGLQEQYDNVTGALTGYQLPIVLWSKSGTTESEKQFINAIDSIVDKCKDHLVKVRDDIRRFDLEKGDLKKLNPLYIKLDDRGKPIPDRSPMLYAKTIYSKKDDKVKLLLLMEILIDQSIILFL